MALKYSSVGGGTGTGFNVQIASKYAYAQFTQAQPAGAYTIKSAGLYVNWDVYLLDASNNLVAYTGGASVNPASAFSAIVVLNGTFNDILQFSYQSTVIAQAETTQLTAGPFITAATPTTLPNINSTIAVTGGNFASGVTATFTGTDLTPRTAKGIVRNSATSLTITRPDNMPVSLAPYTLTLGNPGINNPTNSNSHTFSNITAGVVPVWQTSATLTTAYLNSPYTTTLSATDADGGSSVTLSYVSGSLPSGLSFNSTTGVISGTPSTYTVSSYTYTVRATDSGGNYVDRTFTMPMMYPALTGTSLVGSDATYYYSVFTSNSTATIAGQLTADVLTIAGGGGGGSTIGGGGGAGGMVYSAAQTLSGANTITVGAGSSGSGYGGGSYPAGYAGNPSQFGSLTQALPGGGGGGYNTASYGGNGVVGCSGGSQSTTADVYAHTSSQTNGFGQGGSYNDGNNGSGGGGTGGNGVNGASGGAGAGGQGTNLYSSWLSAISSVMTGVSGWGTATSGGRIAAGGGGGNRNPGGTSSSPGAGGAGGGGAGSTGNNDGNPATQSTGSGGGAGGYSNSVSQPRAGGAGGSGIVIVRYTRSQVGG